MAAISLASSSLTLTRSASLIDRSTPAHSLASSQQGSRGIAVSVAVRRMGQSGSRARVAVAASRGEEVKAVQVDKAELRKRLSQQEYHVTQEKGTERAFTGKYWDDKRKGTYHCICCDTPLFSSSTKFDSGTGWPSFYDQIASNVKQETDWSIPFMPRVEVLCAACNAHLGHVFPDGPPPTRQRYCINSASLRLDTSA
ncbi:unnamed protein product [Closterium sp. NIES-53]